MTDKKEVKKRNFYQEVCVHEFKITTLDVNRCINCGKYAGIYFPKDLDEARRDLLKDYEEYIKAKKKFECSEEGLDRRKQEDCDKSVGLALKNIFLLESIDWLKDVLAGNKYDSVKEFCKEKKELKT